MNKKLGLAIICIILTMSYLTPFKILLPQSEITLNVVLAVLALLFGIAIFVCVWKKEQKPWLWSLGTL